ncbi:hypothetical protein GOV09_02210 [Candidatus Woesearchaeota archaeon]|nr:hypothetical protein [Candidatus Woesearchaeota archaeon]
MKLALNEKTTIGIVAILFALFGLIFFGMSGSLTFLGWIIIIIPFYFILDTFNLSQGEKAIYSIFIGLALFPALTYWPGRLFSFRMVVVIVFAALSALAYFLRKK